MRKNIQVKVSHLQLRYGLLEKLKNLTSNHSNFTMQVCKDETTATAATVKNQKQAKM